MFFLINYKFKNTDKLQQIKSERNSTHSRLIWPKSQKILTQTHWCEHTYCYLSKLMWKWCKNWMLKSICNTCSKSQTWEEHGESGFVVKKNERKEGDTHLLSGVPLMTLPHTLCSLAKWFSSHPWQVRCIGYPTQAIFLRPRELRLMWWRHVIAYPHKTFVNYRNQELAFRRAIIF